MQKKAQVTLFIIIAIVIIALAVFAFFFLRARVAVPSRLQPVESYFAECVDLNVKEAVKIAALQGGYIELPEFEPGSSYMPFSNQLNFLGTSVPYWFYISGNNIAREQKPSLSTIETQFESYLKEAVKECDFSLLEAEGYGVDFLGEPQVDVVVKASAIETTVAWPLTISYGETSARVDERKISTKSNFGSLYNDAIAIYEAEQKNLFLENYSVDVLRLYAPVDGIELSCATKIWQKAKVEQELKSAIEANIAAIKIKGSDYDLARPEHKYFEVDVGRSIAANSYFLYMPSWPSRIEVWPTEDGLMKADPIGTQPGLGVLGMVGLCYVPYHFVYDVYFPVMVQLVRGDELFQFPMIVVIDKNMARNATVAETSEIIFDICQYKTQTATLFSYDEDSRPIEASIYFKCFNQVCPLGETKIQEGKAKLEAMLPRCYNGFIIAKASGYRDAKIQFTTTEPFASNIFLAPVRELEIEMPNLKQGEYALITFTSAQYGASVYYPEQKRINLSEGNYNVSVFVFKESLITIGAQKAEECIKMPASGIAGIFGAMQEQCYDLEVPQQSLTNVLFGGGKAQWFVTEQDLRGKTKISIAAETFAIPKDITGLTDIYGLVDASLVNIQLK